VSLGPDTLTRLNRGYNLASGYVGEGRYDEAISRLRDVIDRYATTVGAAHPETVKARALLTDLTTHRR
jgi:hypothetical protein